MLGKFFRPRLPENTELISFSDPVTKTYIVTVLTRMGAYTQEVTTSLSADELATQANSLRLIRIEGSDIWVPHEAVMAFKITEKA